MVKLIYFLNVGFTSFIWLKNGVIFYKMFSFILIRDYLYLLSFKIPFETLLEVKLRETIYFIEEVSSNSNKICTNICRF